MLGLAYFLILGSVCALPPSNLSKAQTVEFTISEQNLGNTRSFGVVIADVDLDEDNDVLIANYIGPSILWINDGTGYFTQISNSFSPSLSGTDEAHDVDIADLNGDSLPDIFIANHNVPSKIYFNNGQTQFIDSGQNIGSIGDYPGTVQLCDVDNDQDMDALIYNSGAPNRIWINDGNGVFTIKTTDYGGSGSNGMKLGDLNGDSYPDLYISLRYEPNQLWLNDGSGTFSNSGQAFGDKAEDIVFRDLDGDTDMDILIVGGTGIATWINQNNNGTFIKGFTDEDQAPDCALLDADLDGDSDLITSSLGSGNKLWLNDGHGSFESNETTFGTTGALSIACGDLDADDDEDVVFGRLEGTGGNTIYLNESKHVGIIEENNSDILTLKLFYNYPNPFNPSTTIRYELTEASAVTLHIYDILGHNIQTLVSESKPAGHYETIWNGTAQDGTPVGTGVYFSRIQAGSYSEVIKMVYLR